MLTGNNSIIPAVMFHSVGLEGTDWIYNHLSMPLSDFEQRIAFLKNRGWQFIFWSDLYDYMKGIGTLKLPAIMLTFDDGYLDNWVYVYPMLKKYGARATIFVNPEFVDPETTVRKTLEDVWNRKTTEDQLQVKGFLCWEEMRQMEKEGVMDIQSHSLTHTWYFSGPDVIDYHRPGLKQYPWLYWNERPERKYAYMNENQSNFVSWGTPVYTHAKALVCRQYYPPDQIAVHISKHVEDSGGDVFFSRPEWQAELSRLHKTLFEQHSSSTRIETDEEYYKRLWHEIKGSKQMIEKNLGKKVDFICWPGGGYNSTCLKIAKEAGYRSWTLSSRDATSFRNLPGADETCIKRLGAYDRSKAVNRGQVTPFEYLCFLERHKGSTLHKWLGRGLRLKARITHTMGGRNK